MSTLSQNNIYKLSLAEELGRDDLYMLYAPVAGNMLIASAEECSQIEEAISQGPQSLEMQEIVYQLTVGEPANQRDSKVNCVDGFCLCMFCQTIYATSRVRTVSRPKGVRIKH